MRVKYVLTVRPQWTCRIGTDLCDVFHHVATKPHVHVHHWAAFPINGVSGRPCKLFVIHRAPRRRQRSEIAQRLTCRPVRTTTMRHPPQITSVSCDSAGLKFLQRVRRGCFRSIHAVTLHGRVYLQCIISERTPSSATPEHLCHITCSD